MPTNINLDTFAKFTWGFNHSFLIEAPQDKYYVWSSPDYNGDNTIRPYRKDPNDFVYKGFRGRDKGSHFVEHYCGPDVKFVDCD